MSEETKNVIEEIIKKFMGPTTLDALVKVVQEELASKVNISDVVDDLTSENESKKPLSARQGYLLKKLIEDIKVCDMEISAEEIVKLKELIEINHDEFIKASLVMASIAAAGDTDLDKKVASVALVQLVQTSLNESITNLQSTVSDLQSTVEQLESDKSELSEKVDGYEKSINDLTEKNTELEGKVSSLESDLEDLQEKLDAAEKFEEMTEQEVKDIWEAARSELEEE